MPRRNKPIQHNRLVITNNCQPKKQFINEKDALKAAEYQMLVTPNLELSVYQCDTCGKWHLTRQNKKSS